MRAMPRPTMGSLSTERSASRLQHMCTLSFRKGGGLVDAPGRRLGRAKGEYPLGGVRPAVEPGRLAGGTAGVATRRVFGRPAGDQADW
jgi:hypothetical protein